MTPDENAPDENTPDAGSPDQAAPAGPAPGTIARYPVDQPDGTVRHQLVLVTHPADETGHVRGRALCYEDETGAFLPEQFA